MIFASAVIGHNVLAPQCLDIVYVCVYMFVYIVP